MNTNFSISESFNAAWDMLKNNLLLIVLFLIACIPSVLIQGGLRSLMLPTILPGFDPMKFLTESAGPFIGISLLSCLIEYLFLAGMTNAVLTVVKGGKAEFNAFNMPISTYIKFACAYFCYILIIYAGIAMCVIPGIFLGIRLMFVPMIIMDDPECSFTNAFQRSWEMTSGNFWSLFGFSLMTIVVVLLGLLLCCVGILVTVPYTFLATAYLYMQIKEGSAIESVSVE